MDVLADSDSAVTDSDHSAVADWVLLGVKVARNDGQDIWFVRVSSLIPDQVQDTPAPRMKEFSVPFGMSGVKTGTKFVAPASRVRIETFDKDGTLIRASLRTVPQVRSSTTLLDMISGMAAGNEFLVDAAAGDDFAKPNMPATLTKMQLLGGSKALTPIREAIRDHVVTKPSLLAIVLHGLRIKVEAPVNQREVVRSPWSEHAALVPRQQAKFPMLLSGHRLFDCRVVVAPPQPPYHLTAGALLIEAVHPENAANRLTMCVLAAKHVADDLAPLPTVAARP